MTYFDSTLDGSLLISKEDVINAKELRCMVYALEQKFISRVDYILRFWFEKFGLEINTWYFDDALPGEVGSILQNMDDLKIHSLTVEVKGNKDCNHLQYTDGDGKTHTWSWQIPTKWLFQGFEHEVTSGKYFFDQKIDNLAKSAKAKLTVDELNALLSYKESK